MIVPMLSARLSALSWFLGVALVLAQPLPGGGPRVALWSAVLLGVWLCFRHRRHLDTVPVRRLLLVCACLGLPMMLSVPWSIDVVKSLGVLVIFGLTVFAGLVVLVGNRTAALLGRTLDWVSWTGVVWAATVWLQWSGLFAGAGFVLTNDGRATGIFSSLHGTYMLSFLAALPAWRYGRSRPLLAFGLMGLMASAAVLGGTRTSLWTLVLVFVLSLPAFAPRVRMAVFMLPVLGALIFTLTPVGKRQTERFFAPLHGEHWSFEALDAKLTFRLTIWSRGWDVFVDRPILGSGVGTFPKAYKDYAAPGDAYLRVAPDGPAHAHHAWLSVASETGILGLFGLTAMLGLLCQWFWRAPAKARRLAAPWAVILGAYYFPIASHRPLLIVWWFAFIWLVLCCFLAALSTEDNGLESP